MLERYPKENSCTNSVENKVTIVMSSFPLIVILFTHLKHVLLSDGNPCRVPREGSLLLDESFLRSKGGYIVL